MRWLALTFSLCACGGLGGPGLKSGGGTPTSVTTIGSSANANGATVTAGVLALQPASASFGGVMTAAAQPLAGDKTLTGLWLSTAQLLTISDNGAGSHATAVLTVTSHYVRVDCLDTHGCDITIAKSTPQTSALVTIVNAGAGIVNFVDAAGDLELQGTILFGQHAVLQVVYASDRWVEVSRSYSTKTAQFDYLSPNTTQGDISYFDGTNNIRLAKGTAGQILTINAGATAPEWASGGACTADCTFTGTTTVATGVVTSPPAFKAQTTGVPNATWVYGSTIPVYTNYFRAFPTSRSASTFNLAPGGSFGDGGCTGSGSVAGSSDADAYWIATTSGATSGNGQQQSDSNNVAYDHIARLVYVLKTGSTVATSRVWAGVVTSVNTVCNADTTDSTRKIAFRYSTGASDTTWKACSSDGTTQSCSDTGVTVAADTAYVLEFRKSGGTVTFYVDGVLKVTKSTNIPTGTTSVPFMFSISTLENVAKTLKARLIYGEST
jgi:hypothetical protein